MFYSELIKDNSCCWHTNPEIMTVVLVDLNINYIVSCAHTSILFNCHTLNLSCWLSNTHLNLLILNYLIVNTLHKLKETLPLGLCQWLLLQNFIVKISVNQFTNRSVPIIGHSVCVTKNWRSMENNVNNILLDISTSHSSNTITFCFKSYIIVHIFIYVSETKQS